MTTLRDATVLITGATGGFGRELTRQCLDAGSRVVLTDRDGEPLQRFADEAAAASPGGVLLGCIAADLSTREGCESLYQRFGALSDTLDILINNAGIGVYGRHDEVPGEHWEALMQINLLSPMRLMALALPGMIERGRGHVVNVSSIAGWIGAKGLSAYCASKFGLRGAGECLEDELAPYGVKITTVFPYFSRTAIIDSPQYGSLPRLRPPDDVLTDPADIARAMLDGVRHNRAQVFPDKMAKLIHFMQRHFPRITRVISRALEKRIEQKTPRHP